jgi:hypothetical protein
MKYWWATQGRNYEIAIEQKTLWTCPRPGGAALKDSRSIIFELEPRDIVFHYAKGYLQAVSEVKTSWKDFMRPYGYERQPGEGDEGWLVTVEPLKTGLHLHYTRVVQLIRAERPGPFNSPTSVYQGPVALPSFPLMVAKSFTSAYVSRPEWVHSRSDFRMTTTLKLCRGMNSRRLWSYIARWAPLGTPLTVS